MRKKKRNKSVRTGASSYVATEIRAVATNTERAEEIRVQAKTLPPTDRTGVVEWLLVAASSVISFFALATRFAGVNVSVLKDEYIYVLDSHYKDVSGFRLPNELFQFVYSSTKLCGENFYDCARGINAAFVVAGALFIYFLVKLVAQGNLWLASIAGIATIFGSYGTYAAYFMPESIFNFLMVAFFYFLIKFAQSDNWRPWVGMGLIFALATLSKPHAFFVLPAVLLFVVLAVRSNTGSFLLSLVKRLGLLLATIFGTNISISWLSQRIQPTNVFGTYGAEISSPGALAEVLGVATFAQVPGTLLGQTMMIVMSVGLALPIGIIAVLSVLKSGEPLAFAKNRAGALIGLSIANMVAVTALFEAWIGLYTWMHTRYYSYLIPLAFVVLAEAWAKRSESRTSIKQILTIGVFSVLSGIAFFTMAMPYGTNWVDAPDFKFHIDNPAISGFLIVATVVTALIYLVESRSALLVAFVLLSTAYIGAGNHIANYLHQEFGDEIVSDNLARILRSAIPQDQVDRTVIVGPGVVEIDRALFGSLSGSARAQIVSGKSSDLGFLKPDDMWLVTLGDVELEGLHPARVKGPGFSLYGLSDEAKIQSRVSGSLQMSSKCVLPENTDWACGSATEIDWGGDFQRGSIVDVIFEVSGQNQNVSLAVGPTKLEGTFGEGVWATTVTFSGSSEGQRLSILSNNPEIDSTGSEQKFVRILHFRVQQQ
jgi:phosphoglycerol transferase